MGTASSPRAYREERRMKVHVQGLANSTDAETLAEQVLDLKRSKADIEHQLKFALGDNQRCRRELAAARQALQQSHQLLHTLAQEGAEGGTFEWNSPVANPWHPSPSPLHPPEGAASPVPPGLVTPGDTTHRVRPRSSFSIAGGQAGGSSDTNSSSRVGRSSLTSSSSQMAEPPTSPPATAAAEVAESPTVGSQPLAPETLAKSSTPSSSSGKRWTTISTIYEHPTAAARPHTACPVAGSSGLTGMSYRPPFVTHASTSPRPGSTLSSRCSSSPGRARSSREGGLGGAGSRPNSGWASGPGALEGWTRNPNKHSIDGVTTASPGTGVSLTGGVVVPPLRLSGLLGYGGEPATYTSSSRSSSGYRGASSSGGGGVMYNSSSSSGGGGTGRVCSASSARSVSPGASSVTTNVESSRRAWQQANLIALLKDQNQSLQTQINDLQAEIQELRSVSLKPQLEQTQQGLARYMVETQQQAECAAGLHQQLQEAQAGAAAAVKRVRQVELVLQEVGGTLLTWQQQQQQQQGKEQQQQQGDEQQQQQVEQGEPPQQQQQQQAGSLAALLRVVQSVIALEAFTPTSRLPEAQRAHTALILLAQSVRKRLPVHVYREQVRQAHLGRSTFTPVTQSPGRELQLLRFLLAHHQRLGDALQPFLAVRGAVVEGHGGSSSSSSGGATVVPSSSGSSSGGAGVSSSSGTARERQERGTGHQQQQQRQQGKQQRQPPPKALPAGPTQASHAGTQTSPAATPSHSSGGSSSGGVFFRCSRSTAGSSGDGVIRSNRSTAGSSSGVIRSNRSTAGSSRDGGKGWRPAEAAAAGLDVGEPWLLAEAEEEGTEEDM